ncbi:MAG: rod shape-determining protein, partial [Clostridia bacterium]|nr:rod shape-determining protein [Clostridia bacterium]
MASYNDIGIDLGTSNVLIYMKGKGIVLREPAVVAIDRDSRDVLAVGEDARRMVGRTPSSILAIRPLKQGVISDFELASAMLRYFVVKVVGKRLFNRPRAVISLPTGVNEVEKRSIISTMFDAGMRRTQLLEKPIAAALGSGLPIDEAYGSMIVDVGAGVTDVAVLSVGQAVVADCTKVGGDLFDDAIIRHLRRKHNFLIGERTAEELKINIGSAIPRSENLYLEVTGRNLLTGLPKTMRVTSDEITEALDEPLQAFIESIHAVLER